MRKQEPVETMRSQEESGGAKSSQESHEEPGGARRARKSQHEPAGAGPPKAPQGSPRLPHAPSSRLPQLAPPDIANYIQMHAKIWSALGLDSQQERDDRYLINTAAESPASHSRVL